MIMTSQVKFVSAQPVLFRLGLGFGYRVRVMVKARVKVRFRVQKD